MWFMSRRVQSYLSGSANSTHLQHQAFCPHPSAFFPRFAANLERLSFPWLRSVLFWHLQQQARMEKKPTGKDLTFEDRRLVQG